MILEYLNEINGVIYLQGMSDFGATTLQISTSVHGPIPRMLSLEGRASARPGMAATRKRGPPGMSIY